MKKLFSTWSLIIFLLMGLGLSSCSKDDDGDVDVGSLIGKWQLIENDNPAFDPCDFQGWIEFQSDGIFSSYDDCDNSTTIGTWTLDKKTITVVSAPPVIISINYQIISLTTTELVLTMNFMGITVEAHYHKI